MKTPSDPRDPSTASPPQDPVVNELARRIRASSLPEARALVPLSAGERRSLAEQLLGPEKETHEQEGTPPEPPPDVTSPEAKRGPPALRLVPAPAVKKPRLRFWATALAAALGVFGPAFVLIRMLRPSLDPVAYDLRAEGDMDVRADPPAPASGPVRLRPSTRLLVVLTPQGNVPDASLRMLVVRGDRARIARPPYENDGQGKLTIDKPARDALGDQENGPAELVWLVGRPLPEDAEVERIALDRAAAPPRGCAVLRRAAVFEGWSGARRTAPGDIEFAGCKAMVQGPRCEMDPGSRLVLWAPWEARGAQLSADGEAITPESLPAAGGTRWTIQVAAGTRQISLSSPHLESPFQLALTETPAAPDLAEASRLVDENKLPPAEKILDTLKDDSSYSKVTAARLRARIARRQGDWPRAAALYRDAAVLAGQSGRLSDEIESRHVLAHQAIAQGRDHAAAEEELRAALPLEARCPPWRVDGAYYRGMLAQERGRYGEALASFAAVRQSAARLDLTEMEGFVLQPLAELLSIWGREDEAVDLLRRAHALSPDRPCERGRVLTNWAWAEYRAAGTAAARERAASRAEEAIRVLGGEACGTLLATAQMNAALAQVAAGRTGDARKGLEQLRKTASGNAGLAPWMARLELDLDRTEDAARALETAARLEREMQRSTVPELAFEAALGRAAALDALGRLDEAGAAYEEAARRETAWAAAAPLGEGRALFFERQRSAFRRWVDFAVRSAERQASADTGARRAAAFEVARVVRRSLGRFFATLLPPPSSEPAGQSSPPPAPLAGEVHLYCHPIEEGWAAVAINGQGISAVKRLRGSPAGTPAEVSAALLAPFEEVLTGAQRVVFFADRALRVLDLENLPWKGGVLSDQVSVAYGTGMSDRAPNSAPEPAACRAKPFALLVIDPSRNLGGARRAGEHIASRLGAGARVLAGEDATRGAVRDALGDPCTRLFQYDGHAVFGRKKDGVEAALSLADGPLTISDLLDTAALARVPDIVVLSGCETGREEGLGVAHAFLGRGSRQVLATTASVEDALSARLMEVLHEQGTPGAAEWDLALALRGATRSLRGPGAGAGPWAPFRVLVP